MNYGFTVLIPFRNGNTTLAALLNSLPPDLPALVVDDVSDEPPRYVGRHRQVEFMRLEKRGYFSGAVNAGAARVNGDFLILNQDVTLTGDAWLHFINANRREYATIGDGVMNHPAHPKGYVQGVFMFIRRDAWERVGPFNAELYPLWGATAEWQTRACRLGYQALPVKPVPGLTHERGNVAFGPSIQATLDAEPDKKSLYIRTPPAVSVIIPCWNYGRYLHDAVNSLLGGPTPLGDFPPQTFQAFEIIIVNDGSTDDTDEIAKALADDWKGVRYIRRQHRGGTSIAINEGAKAAYGKYLTVLSADDMMEPDRLDYLYRAAEANPGRVVYDDFTFIVKGQRHRVGPLKDYVPGEITDEKREWNFTSLLYQNEMPAGVLYEREAWKRVGGYPDLMANGREDWAMAVRLGAAGYCGLRVPRPGYLYRREGQNRTMTNTGASWRAYFLERMQKLYPELYAGVRPMGCCGGGRVASRSARANGNGANGNGANGNISFGVNAMGAVGQPKNLVRIEYLGESAGKQEWRGPVSGLRYLFGGKRRVGFVDERDLETGSNTKPGLLEIMEGRRYVFQRAPQAMPVAQADAPKFVAPVVAEAVNTAPVVEQVAEETQLEESVAFAVEAEAAPSEAKPKRKAATRKKKTDSE